MDFTCNAAFPLLAIARVLANSVAMNSQVACSRADLEFAESALRDVLAGVQHESKADATLLNHMLTHLVNMGEAISTSPERHDNVAKRLGDFAMTTSRMAIRNPDSAPKLTRLTEHLRTASERLKAS